MPDLLLELASGEDQAKVLRGEIRTWFESERLDPSLGEDALLIASELFSNAVHAVPDHTPIEVGVFTSEDGLTVEVRNTGPDFELETIPLPAPERPGGRGIAIARRLGKVSVVHREGKTIVTVFVPR